MLHCVSSDFDKYPKRLAILQSCHYDEYYERSEEYSTLHPIL